MAGGVAVVVAVKVGQPILRCPGAAAWERCNSRARSKLAVGAGAPPRAAGAMPITPGDLRNLDHEAPWPLLAWSAGLFARNGFASAQELRGAALVDLEGLQDAPRADYREQVARLVARANSSLGRGVQALRAPLPYPPSRRAQVLLVEDQFQWLESFRLRGVGPQLRVNVAMTLRVLRAMRTGCSQARRGLPARRGTGRSRCSGRGQPQGLCGRSCGPAPSGPRGSARRGPRRCWAAVPAATRVQSRGFAVGSRLRARSSGCRPSARCRRQRRALSRGALPSVAKGRIATTSHMCDSVATWRMSTRLCSITLRSGEPRPRWPSGRPRRAGSGISSGCVC